MKKRAALAAAVIAVAGLVTGGLMACGGSTSGGRTGSSSSGETGTVHFQLSTGVTGTVTGETLALLAIQNVFDINQNFLIDCKKKNHQINGEDFCDELIVLPPGVYEIIANPADPNCRSEKNHYKVVVKANETVELAINLVCGAANGGLDVIVKVTEPPIVQDVDFTVGFTGPEANKFICRGGEPIVATVTVTDSDTDCTTLFANFSWLVDGQLANPEPQGVITGIGVASETGPGDAGTVCKFSAVINPNGPLSDFDLTLQVSDGTHDTHFTFPIHIIDCGDAGTPDAGAPDSGTPDAGAPDAGEPDGGDNLEDAGQGRG